MTKFRWTAAAVALTSLVAASPGWARTINLTTLNWSPYYGENLDDGGPVTAIAKAAAKEAGHTLEMSWMPWKRALEMAKRGRRDGLLGAYYNKERDKAFHFTIPMYSVTGSFIAKKSFERDSYESLKDLKGYSMGFLRGGEFPDKFDSADYLDKRPGKNEANMRKLVNGRIDLAAMANTVFFDLLKRKTDESAGDYKALQPPLWNKNLYITISKEVDNGEQIAADLNEGLRAIIENGTYAEIVESYGLKAKPEALADTSPDSM